MHWIFTCFLFFLPNIQDNTPDIITTYKHNNQLILVFASDNRAEDYKTTLLNLSKDPLGLDQRDILIFEVFKAGGIMPDGSALSEEEVERLRNFYQIEPEAFEVVLVDRNNKEIRRFKEPVDVKTILSEFDDSSGQGG